MTDYHSVPLTELRDQLGQVVNDVAESGRPVIVTRAGKEIAAVVPAALLRSGLLPPAYFDDALRAQTIAELDEKINAHTPEEIAQAREWLRRVKAADRASAAGAA
ncbi:type II toxin-antitoxin system Phd/YefM family antitoxin [Nocardia sp. NBC_00508]|uniref:type II toxin-antitoxin system Phd/YefM family antitoxin n=1 Tax=Nocardia sp. NBC_00508 TaxID=2975992 RepID=UPI002E7FEFFA|nr:type II toxin-antitoxin system Phd/YefM family antitoxin [Nocardia sp. NBC_00508]WUD68390.1 type II toxin-antitoxin system Phd/YefM family antitoxin [Nocardia sp. NBC_00508]